MSRDSQPRRGSLQFYPRKRAKRILPGVNWKSISKEGVGLLGFIGYKVGMFSVLVKDNTPHSHTKGKKIILPATVIECPEIKILSVRFYREKKIFKEILNDNIDKEMKRKLKLPKSPHLLQELEKTEKESFEDVRVIIYSQVKKTCLKKTPEIIEIALSGNLNEKLDFIKTNLKKEISIKEVFDKGIVDVRGVTKGKGTQGSTKRFGLSLKSHKAEKGQRGPGSGGPWHPARVTFQHPMSGQMGFFTRIIYNNKIIGTGNISEKDINPSGGFKRYGKVKTSYLILFGSLQGPSKRQLLITAPLRPSKKQIKKNYELLEIR